jgi:dienelactone hydrolase
MPVARTRIAVPAGAVDALRASADDLAPERRRSPGDLPSPSRRPPGILLVHDAWGLDDEIAGLALALADEGFVVLAPDLARGRRAADADEAAALAASVDAADAVKVLAAAADALAGDPGTRPGAMGVVGLGMGAPLAAFLATLRPEIAVVVAIDGPIPELPLEAWGRTEATVVLVAGPGDPDPQDPGGWDADPGLDAVRAAGVEVRLVVPAAVHDEPAADGDAVDATRRAIVSALAERLPPA